MKELGDPESGSVFRASHQLICLEHLTLLPGARVRLWADVREAQPTGSAARLQRGQVRDSSEA